MKARLAELDFRFVCFSIIFPVFAEIEQMFNFQYFCKKALLIIIALTVSGPVNASDFFLQNPSIPCRMLLELEFNNLVKIENDVVVFDETAEGLKREDKFGFDYFAEITGQNKRGSIHREKASTDFILIIQDRDLPCRAILASSPPQLEAPLAANDETQKPAAASAVIAVAEVEVSQTTAVVQPAAPVVQPVAPVVEPAPPVVQPATPVVQSAAPVVQPVVSVGDASAQQVQQVNRAMSPAEAQIMIDEVHARITLYNVIAGVIKDKPRSRQARVLSIVDGEISRLQSEKAILEALLSQRFATPIRPSNANLSVSAFRAADTFPKIPYYVPGTNEFGEMLIVPRVSDEGALNYEFDFIDPVSSYAKVRDRIVVPHDEIEKLISGLEKVDEWTTVAQENNITRRVSKVASCFPEINCGEKAVGKSSTEVVFQIYEDGATSGRIQRNKGQYVVGYNMSVESSILLGAYLIYMEEAGAKEFNIGVMTDDQVLELFD